MPLPVPDLDTRTWQDLVREARLRIPRYTPEWTDLNDSDPGITLVQLFAWLTEMTLFQMNRLPDRNYVEFLNLLAMEPRPAQPSTAYLSFLAESDSVPPRIPAGTGVLSQVESDEGVPIVFETSAELPMIRARLAAVQVRIGPCYADVSEANATRGELFFPFGRDPQAANALYLGFGEAPEETEDEEEATEEGGNLFVTPVHRGAARGRVERDRGAADSPFGEMAALRLELALGDSATAPPVVRPRLSWSVSMGMDRRGRPSWRPVTVRDDTEGLTRSGTIWLDDLRRARRAVVGEVPDALFYLRCEVESWGTSPARATDAVLPNTIPAESLETVRDEVLGDSTGLADQYFTLEKTPVARDSLELRIELSDGTVEAWHAVRDLFAAGPGARVFTLDPSNGVLRFGNGRHGRIPELGALVVARRYRFGGGAAANVSAGLIDTPLTDLGDLEVTNWRPAAGGQDEETVAEVKARAPLALRNRDRAVTAEDYAALATDVGGVAQAVTLPFYDPCRPGEETLGVVSVVILPEASEGELWWLPQPSRQLLEEVDRYLRPRRMVTTELFVIAPTFVELGLEMDVLADPVVGVEAVEAGLRRALADFFGPERQRVDAEFFPGQLYVVAQEVEGLRAVTRLVISVGCIVHESLEEPIDPGPAGFFVIPPERLVLAARDAPALDGVAFDAPADPGEGVAP